MIREMIPQDLETVTQLWLEENIKAHPFINPSYWKENKPAVKESLVQAEIYVYEANHTILGFIGLDNNYIAGIFVAETAQSKGIGKALLDKVKSIKNELSLCVYKKNKRAYSFYEREQFKQVKEGLDITNNEIDILMTWKKTSF